MCQARIRSAQPTAAANAAPRTATSGRRRGGRDEHRAQGERERRGRVSARPRGWTEVNRAGAGVRMGEQRLEHLGAQGRQRHHDRDRQRDPRAFAGERDEDERDAPDREQQRVEQVQQEVRDCVHPRSFQKREVAQRDRIPHVRRRHELGDDPHERHRQHAQAGDPQRARRPGAGRGRRPRAGAVRRCKRVPTSPQG